MDSTPDDLQPPQASASTNSAIRAQVVNSDEESQETTTKSSGVGAANKFYAESVAENIRALGPQNQNPFSQKTRQRAAASGAGFTHRILERRERRPRSFSGSRRMSAELLAEVEAQKRVLDACPGSSESKCIYVLVQRSGVGYVKIGTTVDPLKRTGDHQGNAYGELKLLAAFHGDADDERALHRRFASDLVWGHREHFWPSRQVLRWVEDVIRLNGRDGAQCWSCRAAGLVLPLPRARLLPVDLSPRVERVNMTCGNECQRRFAWFDRKTRHLAHGLTSNGMFSATPIVTARALYEHDALSWCVRIWLADRDRRGECGCGVFPYALETNSLGIDADEHNRLMSCSFDLHHKARQMLPEGESIPWNIRTDNLGDRESDHSELVAAICWLSDDLLLRYGVVAICGCASNYAALEAIERSIGPYPYYKDSPFIVTPLESP